MPLMPWWLTSRSLFIFPVLTPFYHVDWVKINPACLVKKLFFHTKNNTFFLSSVGYRTQVRVPVACCTWRPDKLKCQSLEQRKVYCRAKQGERVGHAQEPQTPWWFWGRSFIGKIWGCVTFFWLVGGEATGRGSSSLVLSLELASPTWMGALVPEEDLKDIVVYSP